MYWMINTTIYSLLILISYTHNEINVFDITILKNILSFFKYFVISIYSKILL